MAWFDEAIIYHIYPIGLSDSPKINSYKVDEHRLNKITPWISHIKKLGCTALYIGPLFESVGHGYETTDYKKLDSRLGTNEDLIKFIKECHKEEIKVILDGVFNHVGRDFFAFKDLLEKRENSPYRDWFCNVNFGANNEYNDGLCYDNWGGHNLLVKLNQKNPAVIDFIKDVIYFWVKEFDIDGIRLDAADVLDFDFMKQLRAIASDVKPDFWLLGEVIHGDYTRWVNEQTLHAVTNYVLHKALYSAHNDHNYFEIAHTIKRLQEMGPNLKLYNFVDNHDVARIYTKLDNKSHFTPAHIMLFTLPGIPSIYYGSEFGIEGQKEQGSDFSLRPALNLDEFKDSFKTNQFTKLVAKLCEIRKSTKALSYGEYKELFLSNRQYVFERTQDDTQVIIAVNNDDNDFSVTVKANSSGTYTGAIFGDKQTANNRNLTITIKANSGEIYIPNTTSLSKPLKVKQEKIISPKPEPKKKPTDKKTELVQKTEPEKKTPKINISVSANKPYEEMTIEELQSAILKRMEQNGPVTEQMKKDVYQNTHHGSLVTWIKSFN